MRWIAPRELRLKQFCQVLFSSENPGELRWVTFGEFFNSTPLIGLHFQIVLYVMQTNIRRHSTPVYQCPWPGVQEFDDVLLADNSRSD